MLYEIILITHIHFTYVPSQVTFTGEQHWPGGQVKGVSTHLMNSEHPPLLMEHEYSQYVIPVSLHTLQIDPLGHS